VESLVEVNVWSNLAAWLSGMTRHRGLKEVVEMVSAECTSSLALMLMCL
jgi:hypothetical protein